MDVNVISLDAKVKVEEEERGKSLPKDKGKAKVEEVDAMPIKRARQEEAAMSETGERRKSKENGESNSKKKSKPRREITIKYFALGETSQPYNLVDDVLVQGPKITWSQLLHLAPKVRRQWTKMVSTRRVKTKAMGLVSGRNLQDTTPVLNAYVKGQRVSNVYVDGGAQICFMTEQTMHRLGLKVNALAPCKAKMANNSKVKCLGVINSLKIKVCEIEVEVDVYVMPTKEEGYPIILGRPWLMTMQARQDWVTGMLKLQSHKGAKKGKAIQIDLREGKHESLDLETSVDEFSSSDYSKSEEESTITDESDSSQAEIIGVTLTNPTMVSSINVPQVEEGFIYPVENSKWVSLVVVTPKKNGKWRVCVDYKPLNAATKRNQFPLPFQDEILNKVAGYESSRVLHLEKVNEGLARLQSLGGQLNVHKCHIAESQVTLLVHVVSSRGIEANPGKVQALVSFPSPKSARELVSFIQKVRGPGFRGDLVGELMKKLEIERRHSTPYYPQCSGLVEKVNGMIYKIITKHMVSKPKDWDKHLSAALWAYRTSFRTSLDYTLYHLVFGKEEILPIEVQLASLKILATKNEGTPSDQLKQVILDLERLELDREMAIEHYTTQVERRRQKFIEGLKDKELKRGMLVLCYNNRFDTRKDKKLMPRWEGPNVIRKKYTNGSYRLQNISGKLHKTRVNGWRLKPYFQRFDAEVVVNLPPKTREEEEEDDASSSQQLCEGEELLEA
ncbi:hypothetical protein L7F22_007735 [Adiantum nelumboides]|nr:hypothetical protein [Adiantum nelumboides]